MRQERLARPAGAEPMGRREVVFVVLIAALLAGVSYFAQRRSDFTIDEEGFQWYGSIAAAHGEVPLRDFYSYDPGRYYWAAAWSKLCGDGLLALRFSTALFGALGLAAGLLAARRTVRSRWQLVPLALALLVWMHPRNRLFEPAIAMAGIFFAVRLIEKPSPRRHAAAGALVGLAAVFGKNHGAYLLLSFLLLILYLWWLERREGPDGLEGPSCRAAGGAHPAGFADLWRRVICWAGGIAAGFSPVVVMMVLVPGFARSYLDSVSFFFEQGQTNFPLPIPWPWRDDYAGLSLADLAQTLSFSTCFLLWPLFLAAGTCVALTTRRRDLPQRALLLACLAVGATYWHYAFSRADLPHLAPSIHPLLLGLVALPGTLGAAVRRRHSVVFAFGVAASLWIAAATLLTALPASPLFRELASGRFVAHTVAGEELRLAPRTADFLAWAEQKVASQVPADAAVFLAPALPGLYPILHRRSPVWDIYPIWPAHGRLDDRMLGELAAAHVHWALLQDAGVDLRPDLSFRATHPRTAAYLDTRFEQLATWRPRRPGRCTLLRER